MLKIIKYHITPTYDQIPKNNEKLDYSIIYDSVNNALLNTSIIIVQLKIVIKYLYSKV